MKIRYQESKIFQKPRISDKLGSSKSKKTQVHLKLENYRISLGIPWNNQNIQEFTTYLDSASCGQCAGVVLRSTLDLFTFEYDVN